MVNMEKLMRSFQKHKPEVVPPFIEEYCIVSEQPGHDKKFNFGFGSLKWAMYRLHEIDNDNLQIIFYGIMCEFKLDMLNENDIQFKVQKSYFLRKYRKELNQWPSIPAIENTETFTVGEYTFAVNTSNLNLTSRIFRHTNVDAIVFVNPVTLEAGVAIRIDAKLNNLEGFKQYLLNILSQKEEGWSICGEHRNRVMTYGKLSENTTGVTIVELQSLINDYFNK